MSSVSQQNDTDDKFKQSVQVNNSITTENLANVDIVFSDKTGTLTRNELEFIDFVGNGALTEDAISFQLALCNTLFIRNKYFVGES